MINVLKWETKILWRAELNVFSINDRIWEEVQKLGAHNERMDDGRIVKDIITHMLKK